MRLLCAIADSFVRDDRPKAVRKRVNHARTLLEKEGYEVLVFHATGDNTSAITRPGLVLGFRSGDELDRKPDTERQVIIALTPHGDALRHQAARMYPEVAAASGCSLERVVALREELNALRANLAKVA